MVLDIDGRRTFLVGYNYWSRAGGPRMWERFDAALMDREVALMRAMGANVCRSFLMLPSFMPEPPAVSRQAVERFLAFLGSCERHGLRTMPSLLVGHMSGENFGFPGQRGRSVYTDPEILSWTVALIDAVVGAARGRPAVLGWVLSNEMPLWGGSADIETISAWIRKLVDRIRAIDPGKPVGTGDGVMNAKGGQNGFDAAAIAAICDWVGPHSYFSDIDAMRHGLQTEALVRGLTALGRPVLLEEFGCSSTQASDENAAGYYRETLHGLLSMGAAGAIGWCFSDFALEDEIPYRHHAFELGFGAFSVDGQPKSIANEMLAVSRLASSIDLDAARFAQPRAAILVPSYFRTDTPFSWEDRTRMRRCLLEAYALGVRAGLELTLVEEGAPLDGFALFFVPSTQKLLTGTWRAIEERVRAGATAYISFFYSDHAFHQGMWWHSFESMTGCRHGLRYGLPDDPGDELSVGDARVQIRSDNSFATAYLPLTPLTAEVVFWDTRGRVVLTRNAVGSGSIYFCAFPLEYYLSRVPDVHRDDRFYRLYEEVGRAAGLARAEGPVEAHPWVQQRAMGTPSGELLWLINRSDRPIMLPLRTGMEQVFPAARQLRHQIDLGCKGVAVLRTR